MRRTAPRPGNVSSMNRTVKNNLSFYITSSRPLHMLHFAARSYTTVPSQPIGMYSTATHAHILMYTNLHVHIFSFTSLPIFASTHLHVSIYKSTPLHLHASTHHRCGGLLATTATATIRTQLPRHTVSPPLPADCTKNLPQQIPRRTPTFPKTHPKAAPQLPPNASKSCTPAATRLHP